VINATQGAFRSITGTQNPKNYTIKTPVATVGIRGSVIDFLITGNRETGYSLTVIVVECCAIVTLPTGQVINLTTPGMAYNISNNGTVTGPVQWDGTIVNAAGGMSFPMYGWYVQGEQQPNGLPQQHTGSIDQLNAVIASQLTTIMSPDHDFYHHHHHHHHGGDSE
jgi:hypothetical protein